MPDPEPITMQVAVRCVWARRLRKQKPLGSFNGAGLWVPMPAEERECCFQVKPPTDHDRISLYRHCMTIRHIAHLFGVHPIELTRAFRASVRRAREAIEKENNL